MMYHDVPHGTSWYIVGQASAGKVSYFHIGTQGIYTPTSTRVGKENFEVTSEF